MKESLQVSMENVEYESRVNFHGDLKKDESDAEASTTRGSRSVDHARKPKRRTSARKPKHQTSAWRQKRKTYVRKGKR